MVASWRGTWFAPVAAGLPPAEVRDLVRFRLLLLACIFCGVIQKPLIAFAWDVQTFEDCLRELHTKKASLALMGGTAILLRQVFAVAGQLLVKEVAVALADAGTTWKQASLSTLLRRLSKLSPRDSGKRRGRMSQFTGPSWIQKVAKSKAHLKSFSRASRTLGQMFCASAEAEEISFHTMCQSLHLHCKLPLVGRYSVPHLVRACYVARQGIDGTWLEITEDAWVKDLRGMHTDRTAGIFDLLGVHAYADATGMLATLTHVARSFYSFRTAAAYGRASLVDLPCQACELGGVLGAVKKHLSIRGRGVDRKAADWILSRLPSSPKAMLSMAMLLKQNRARVEGRGNGLDLQCSGIVAGSWLASSPQELGGRSMLAVFTRGSGGPFDLLPLGCEGCFAVFPLSPSTRLWLCESCRGDRRREWDRKRQAARRASGA